MTIRVQTLDAVEHNLKDKPIKERFPDPLFNIAREDQPPRSLF
jgi:hypothetical protein